MVLAEAMAGSHSGRAGLLHALADPERPAIAADHVAVVVAHPDDETIGCGAQLPRLRGATIIVVTDGAPRSLVDARHYGFPSAEAYAAARRRELVEALAVAGIAGDALVSLALADQSAALHLAETARRLAGIFAARRIMTVLTHAYEGGHPDHDATAFAVHAAAALRRRNDETVAIIEMPFYALGACGMVMQQFVAAADDEETIVRLSSAEQTMKRTMIAAHQTQRATLAPFAVAVERFRSAPPYDFTALPNNGRLHYERFPWGMSGERWLALAHQARLDLSLDVAPWR